MRKGDAVKLVFVLLASSFVVLGATVDGVVMNATTGMPQPSVIISLVQPGANGMQTLGSVKSGADGKFRIDKDYPPGPALVQALYQGATYNLVLTPGSPTAGLKLDIYDSTAKAGTASVAQDMILLEPGADTLRITETVLVKNDTKLTFQDPVKGSAQFYVPPAAGDKVQVTVQAPDGMPIQRPGEKTSRAGVYKIGYPLKPGETRFDLVYSMPAPTKYSGVNVHPGAPTRLVTPGTVTLSGDGIESLGQEPNTKAHIYSVSASNFEAKIEGTGTLRTPEDGNAADENGQPPIEQVPPRVYTRLAWVLGLALAILFLGGALLYRKGTA
jgi:hypothetical protein